MEKIIHGKKLKTTPYGASINGSGWDKDGLQKARSNWKSGTEGGALHIFGINKSQLNDVFSAAIEMIEINEKDTE